MDIICILFAYYLHIINTHACDRFYMLCVEHTCNHVQVSSHLDYFMQLITLAVQLMHTRLVHITTKLMEITKRREGMEMSMRLLHESV